MRQMSDRRIPHLQLLFRNPSQMMAALSLGNLRPLYFQYDEGEDDVYRTSHWRRRSASANPGCSPPNHRRKNDLLQRNLCFGTQSDQLCDLVILCHTLPEMVCTGLAETIRARWPRTAILLVTPTRAWESPYSAETINAITSVDPQRLIVRTVELLSQRRSTRPNPPRIAA